MTNKNTNGGQFLFLEVLLNMMNCRKTVSKGCCWEKRLMQENHCLMING